MFWYGPIQFYVWGRGHWIEKNLTAGENEILFRMVGVTMDYTSGLHGGPRETHSFLPLRLKPRPLQLLSSHCGEQWVTETPTQTNTTFPTHMHCIETLSVSRSVGSQQSDSVVRPVVSLAMITVCFALQRYTLLAGCPQLVLVSRRAGPM